MTKTLSDAMAEAASLPEAVQDRIGAEVLAHIARLRALRADIDAGLRSLDDAKGRELDIDTVIRRARDERVAARAVAAPTSPGGRGRDGCSRPGEGCASSGEGAPLTRFADARDLSPWER